MIAPPIGYPIALPKVNPIGFGSPDPDPDTRSRSWLAFVFLRVQDLPLHRSVTRASSRTTAGAGK